MHVPQDASPRVGRGDADEQRPRDGAHGGPECRDDFPVGVGAVVAPPVGDLVQHCGDHGVATDGPERGRVDLDADAVSQLDGLGGAVRDHTGEHRARIEQTVDVAHEGPGLPSVAGDEGQRPALAGGEHVRVRAEAGEVDRDQGGDPRLASTPTDHEPCLARRLLWARAPAGVPAEEGQLLGVH